MITVLNRRALDIADDLEREAIIAEGFDPDARDVAVMRSAAALIRDLDRAISHMVAVKGSHGLSPWAASVLHDAITRQRRRGDG